MQSYVEEHSADEKPSAECVESLASDGLATLNRKAGDAVGSFVELAKPGGTVYAGHIHQHKTFMSKGREFTFIGSPYE